MELMQATLSAVDGIIDRRFTDGRMGRVGRDEERPDRMARGRGGRQWIALLLGLFLLCCLDEEASDEDGWDRSTLQFHRFILLRISPRPWRRLVVEGGMWWGPRYSVGEVDRARCSRAVQGAVGQCKVQ